MSKIRPPWPVVTAALIGLPMLYVASFGPVNWLVGRHGVCPIGLPEGSSMDAKLSLDQLQKIPPGKLSEFLWDHHLRFNLNDRGLPPAFRVMWLTNNFRCEMDNGGIQQYITNHTCTVRDPSALADVQECLEALRLIGDTEGADLLNEALGLYEQYGWPLDPAERWLNFPPEAEAICESVDDRWFDGNGEEAADRNLRLCEQYLREHLEDCVIE